ncbi:hypothetical protein LCGC14_1205270, partial [marine sediment metagenome]
MSEAEDPFAKVPPEYRQPRLRPDLRSVYESPTTGKGRVRIVDPQSGRQFSFDEQEHFLFRAADGTAGLAQIQARLQEETGKAMPAEELRAFFRRLHILGLLAPRPTESAPQETGRRDQPGFQLRRKSGDGTGAGQAGSGKAELKKAGPGKLEAGKSDGKAEPGKAGPEPAGLRRRTAPASTTASEPAPAAPSGLRRRAEGAASPEQAASAAGAQNGAASPDRTNREKPSKPALRKSRKPALTEPAAQKPAPRKSEKPAAAKPVLKTSASKPA